MKKRKKKLKYKNIILLIITTLLLIISIFIFYKSLKLKITNNKNQKIHKKTVIKKENKKQPEQLNKVTYKDGFYYEDLSEKVKEKITGCSFPKSFDERYSKISYDDLKYVKVKYYNFDNEIKEGEIIINKLVAQDVVEIFYKLFEEKYQIEKMNLVEEYNCDDELSMEDNNTSAFNYRILEEETDLSWHAFGLAIDINPLYNPYVYGNEIYPKTATKYKDRTLNIKGMITKNDTIYKIFKEYGWSWGGDFNNTKDYQHFFKEGVLDRSIRERKDN